MSRGYEVYSIGVGTSPTNRINYESGHMVIALHTGNLMVNLPPELGSPDVWAGGGIGLIAGLLLRYVLVRVLVVFKLFGRTWTLDLKDNDHTEPR